MKKLLSISILVFLTCFAASAQEDSTRTAIPDCTVSYLNRDGEDLLLDIYQPSCEIADSPKPTIVFLFGGGFMSGSRNDKSYIPWFKQMTERGYRIISIDYRLGLKGVHKVGLAQKDLVFKAVQMAADDAFSATVFLLRHASEYGIDPDNIVLSGSSAGAITALQCEYEICNRDKAASGLPEGFNYSGIVSFSGGIGNVSGPFGFKSRPCPVLLCHGTKDNIVPYDKIAFFNTGMFGPCQIVKDFEKKGYDNYWILRYPGRKHDIAGSMLYCMDIMDSFIQRCVMGKAPVKIDAMVYNEAIPVFKLKNLDDLYSEKKAEGSK